MRLKCTFATLFILISVVNMTGTLWKLIDPEGCVRTRACIAVGWNPVPMQLIGLYLSILGILTGIVIIRWAKGKKLPDWRIPAILFLLPLGGTLAVFSFMGQILHDQGALDFAWSLSQRVDLGWSLATGIISFAEGLILSTSYLHDVAKKER